MRNWIAVNAVQQATPQQKMKTKTTSNPGTLSRSLFTSLLAIAAACLSVGNAWTAHAQSTPTPTPTDLFASENIGGTLSGGGSSIARYTPDGTPTTFASNLDTPRGLAFDSGGNLFVATNSSVDQDPLDVQGTILKISPDGLMSTFATGFGTGFFLTGLATDSAGNVFVRAQNQNVLPAVPTTIYKITPGGTVITFGSVPSGSQGLAFAAGNLFAGDGAGQTIYKFTCGGARSVFAGPAAFVSGEGPTSLTFDSLGNLFVSAVDNDTLGNGEILEFPPDFAPDGTPITFAAGLTNLPRGLAFGAGNLFVADVGLGSPGDILEFTPDGMEISPPFASPIGIGQNHGAEFLAFAPPNTSIVSTVTTAVTLTFPEGTSAGTTTITTIASPSATPSPSEFDLGNPPLGAFDITTRVVLPNTTPPPQIIIAFQVLSFEGDQDTFNNLQVLHWNGAGWDNVTASDPARDWTTKTIYASVSSLSPFVIAKLRYGAQVQQPINAGGTSVFSVRRGVVPVKFTLTQDGAATCALPAATIALTRTSGGTTGAIDESVYSGSADTGSNFRISNCQYIYNLSASALGVGTYRADIKINGTVVGNAIFQLK
jgi:sugar lactone lactonase YvrE